MPAKIDLIESACVVCDSNDYASSDSITWRGEVLHYVICRQCGLKYMRPRPTREWYLEFYEREFWDEKVEYRDFSRKQRQSMSADAGMQKRLEKQRWRAERIRQLLEPHRCLNSSAVVLDVGAAFGVTLHTLRERYGCQVLAVEPSQIARDYGSSELNVPYVGRYMEDLFEPQAFDRQVSAVLMSHVLENMVDPREALTAVRRMLCDDGCLYIDTCNFYYNNAINPYHPFIFNADTLTDLLAQTGFHVVAQHADEEPPKCAEPTDPYLVLVSRPGTACYTRRPVQVDRLLELQRIGLERYEANRSRRKLEKVFPAKRRSAPDAA
jgi:SAM-dependent methyltransferase